MEKIKCSRCGYDKCKAALDIHHILTPKKQIRNGKMIVLCANCHREEHWGKSARKRKEKLKFRCGVCNKVLREFSGTTIDGKEYDLCMDCWLEMDVFVWGGYDRMAGNNIFNGCDKFSLSMDTEMPKRKSIWLRLKREKIL